MLTSEQAAHWLGLSVHEVLAKSKGRNPKIAAYWLNRRLVRFHPRAIIAKMARDSGQPLEFVGAMFGELQMTKPGPARP